MRYWVIKKCAGARGGYSATFFVDRGAADGAGVVYDYSVLPTLRSAIAYAKSGGLMGKHYGEIIVYKEA